MSSPAGFMPSAANADSATDAVESLYRPGDGAARPASGVRAFEPALRPPEDTDGYGWLYRPAETPAVPHSATAALPPIPALSTNPALSTGPVGTPSRRWPALLLLAAALLCTTLLALLAPSTL